MESIFYKKHGSLVGESLVSLHYGVGVQPHEFHLNKDHDNMPGKLCHGYVVPFYEEANPEA